MFVFVHITARKGYTLKRPDHPVGAFSFSDLGGGALALCEPAAKTAKGAAFAAR
jgi:hypothetical protein